MHNGCANQIRILSITRDEECCCMAAMQQHNYLTGNGAEVCKSSGYANFGNLDGAMKHIQFFKIEQCGHPT